MKIMLPTSGGLDSSVLLHEVLTTTDHEVVAVHYAENWTGALAQGADAGSRSLPGMIRWLTENGRPFEFREGVLKHESAAGFRYAPTHDSYWRLCRYATHGYNARELGVDEAWLALTTWKPRVGFGRWSPSLPGVHRHSAQDSMEDREPSVGPFLRHATMPIRASRSHREMPPWARKGSAEGVSIAGRTPSTAQSAQTFRMNKLRPLTSASTASPRSRKSPGGRG